MGLDLLNIRFLDILDILIVSILLYQIYRLLRGTIAFNIFVGVVLLYLTYFLVEIFEMELLSLLLGKFVGFGVIILIIIFQPEIRRFLLVLGDTMIKSRSSFLSKIFGDQISGITDKQKRLIDEVVDAVAQLSQKRMGGLLVFTEEEKPATHFHSETIIDAEVTSQLIQSIFYKNSPLHDGATIIRQGRIIAASVVLPVSENSTIDKALGLRHRAGIGITEVQKAFAVIISEETGEISFTLAGEIERNLSLPKLRLRLEENL